MVKKVQGKSSEGIWGMFAWAMLPLWILVLIFYPNRNVDFVIINFSIPLVGIFFAHCYSKINNMGKILQYVYLILLLLSIFISAYSYSELTNPLYYKTKT